MNGTQRRALSSLIGVLALVMAVVVATGTIASASSLGLRWSGNRPAISGAQRCGTGAIAVTMTAQGSAGSYTGVSATGIPASCSLVASVTLIDVNGTSTKTVVSPIALTAPTGSTPGPTTQYTATAPFSVAAGDTVYPYVTLGGWPVSASWSAAPVSGPLVLVAPPCTGCTAAWTIPGGENSGSQTNYNVQITLTNNTGTAITDWTTVITATTSNAPFLPAVITDGQQGAVAPIPGTAKCTSSAVSVTIKGNSGKGTGTIPAHGTLTLQLIIWRTSPSQSWATPVLVDCG